MFSVQVPVAHRDLKSSNIVLKSREECVICDFGLARDITDDDNYIIKGNVGHMHVHSHLFFRFHLYSLTVTHLISNLISPSPTNPNLASNRNKSNLI